MPTLHFYPGMGATAAMYADRAWSALPNASFHDWPAWQGEASLEAWAGRLIGEHGIQPEDIVIGSSLGGMVACEIANQTNLDAIVLLGSATNRAEINCLLTLIHPLADLAPLAFIQQSAGKVPNELATMFAESDPAFIRAMCKAIFRWNGLQSKVRLVRLHGKNDHVIPPPPVVDTLIDGGHLIAMTHPQVCADALRCHLRSKA